MYASELFVVNYLLPEGERFRTRVCNATVVSFPFENEKRSCCYLSFLDPGIVGPFYFLLTAVCSPCFRGPLILFHFLHNCLRVRRECQWTGTVVLFGWTDDFDNLSASSFFSSLSTYNLIPAQKSLTITTTNKINLWSWCGIRLSWIKRNIKLTDVNRFENRQCIWKYDAFVEKASSAKKKI